MVNNNIQGPIVLDGLGFVAKRKRNYNPGEYRTLKNVELHKGMIRNRDGVRSTYALDTVAPGITNPYSIIGFMDSDAIVVTKTTHTTYGVNGNSTLWAPTSLPVPAGTTSFHRILFYVRYNKVHYWITHKYTEAGAVHEFWAYSEPVNPLAAPSVIVFADLTATLLFTLANEYQAMATNAYIHKERLVITTNRGIYLSKATDPLVFAAPLGAFFKFPEQNINYSMAVKDTIIILCDSSIYVLTYSADPNLDSTVRQLSDALGGDHGVIHNSTPYFVNNTGIYTVNGVSLDNVSSWIFEFDYKRSKLVSANGYIIVLLRDIQNYNNNFSIFDANYFNDIGYKFAPTDTAVKPAMNNNVFFMNMETGSVHVLDFKDSLDTAEKGYVVDIAIPFKKDFFGSNEIFLLTNKFISNVAGILTYKGNIYRLENNQDTSNIFIFDEIAKSDGTIKRYKPNYQIEIEYTPDGNEYLFKKFRSLEIMGTFPFNDFGLQWCMDTSVYNAVIDVNDDNSFFVNDRLHHPFRVGINQRGRSINLFLATKNPTVELGVGGFYDQLEISDMRLLWTYTGRSNEKKSITA